MDTFQFELLGQSAGEHKNHNSQETTDNNYSESVHSLNPNSKAHRNGYHSSIQSLVQEVNMNVSDPMCMQCLRGNDRKFHHRCGGQRYQMLEIS